MSEDYTLKYTNGYANHGKIDDAELTIEGDCKITNYDPRVDDGKSKGEITIDFSGGEQTVKAGTGNGYTQTQKADFSKKKFSIFKEIAALDGDVNELSVDDIRKMDKSLIQKWGLNDLRFDFKNGVATLVWGKNDILRIDFTMKDEKQPSQVKETDTTKKTEQVSQVAQIQKPQSKTEIAKVISKFTGGNISIDYVHDLTSVAKYTGIPESYIKDILIGLEGKKQWPLCKAEYDNVPKKGYPKGFLTIGFGHTSLAGVPKVTEGMEITEKQAFQILANDIVEAVKLSRNTLRNRGLNFDTIPESIQCAIVDIVFNKGPSEINSSLLANLEAGYYGAAARRTWYDTPNVGLQKRNMYRFIAAIYSLTASDKQSAIERFRSDHFDQLLAVFNKDIDAKTAWNNMCKSVPYQAGIF